MEEYTLEQATEIRTCADDFRHFAKNWLKIFHPKKGMITLEMYPFQERLIKDYETHRFNILTKFRQGGFSTVTAAWCLWRCIFKLDQRIMWLSPSDREAVFFNNHIRSMIKNLPEWLCPKLSKENDHRIIFEDTNSTMFFGAPCSACGISMNLLILDEPAFIKNMDKHWKALYPTISCGGHVIALGTPNECYGWFFDTYTKATAGANDFNVFKADYLEHPDYSNVEWIRMMKENLGQRGWAQEVLQSFTSRLLPDDSK